MLPISLFNPLISLSALFFQYVVSIDQGKFASLTIKGVSMEDSGRYTMIVQNKYGGESVDIVVSVCFPQQTTGFIQSRKISLTICGHFLPESEMHKNIVAYF